jgi:glycosyltransferase involved in cell wall biosynthesis
MKILLIGEFSNVHATLAEGLRRLGHTVTVASDGDAWKNYPRDIDLSRKKGTWGGCLLMLKIARLLPTWRHYDVVQIISPMFLPLKAEKNFLVYKYLRKHNRKVFLGVNGNDWYVINACCTTMPLRYSDFNRGTELIDNEYTQETRNVWMGTIREKMTKQMYQSVNGIIPGLYEYWACCKDVFPQKTRFIPYPITPLSPTLLPQRSKLRLFIGISKQRSAYKGTDIMLKAAQDILKKYPQQVELKVAEGVPFEQYQQMMDDSDVLLDQLYSYTPAMNALLAMSKGMIVVGGGEPENYEILGETELRPIINVEPNYDSVFHELEQLVLHPERIPELKQQSIEYIKKHHDYVKVAMQYVDFWNR